eukprot:5067950-Pleurochrysis_carterae.AAC.1
MPMLAAAVAAGAELRLPFFLEGVRLVVTLRIDSFAVRLAVRGSLKCVALRKKSSARLTSVDRAVFASFHFREHIAYGGESGGEMSGGGCQCDLHIQQRADVLTDAPDHRRELIRHHAFGK